MTNLHFCESGKTFSRNTASCLDKRAVKQMTLLWASRAADTNHFQRNMLFFTCMDTTHQGHSLVNRNHSSFFCYLNSGGLFSEKLANFLTCNMSCLFFSSFELLTQNPQLSPAQQHHHFNINVQNVWDRTEVYTTSSKRMSCWRCTTTNLLESSWIFPALSPDIIKYLINRWNKMRLHIFSPLFW